MRRAPALAFLLVAATAAVAEDRVPAPRARRVVQTTLPLGPRADVVAAGVDAAGGVSVLLDVGGGATPFAWRRFAADGAPIVVAADALDLPTPLTDVKFDAAGGAIAVGGDRRVALVRIAPDGTTSAPLDLDPDLPANWTAHDARIAVRPDGFVHAAFVETWFGSLDRLFWQGVAADGARVGPAVRLTTDEFVGDEGRRRPISNDQVALIAAPTIAVAADGDARIVFQSSKSERSDPVETIGLGQRFLRVRADGGVAATADWGAFGPACPASVSPSPFTSRTSAALRGDGTTFATTAANYSRMGSYAVGYEMARYDDEGVAPVSAAIGLPRGVSLLSLLFLGPPTLRADAAGHVFQFLDWDGTYRLSRPCSGTGAYFATRRSPLQLLSRIDLDGSSRAVRVPTRGAAVFDVTPAGDLLFAEVSERRDGRGAPSVLWLSSDLKRSRRLAFTPAVDATRPVLAAVTAGSPTRFATAWTARGTVDARPRAFVAFFE